MLHLEYKNGYAIVQLDHGKVNAIGTEMSKKLKETFLQLAQEEEVGGVILTGRPHVFSGGLDVMEMAQWDLAACEEFWRQYLGALQAMVRYPLPFVCAITGYAPAGGTILVLCADYRIMAKGPKHVMGMHEFKMSMMIPKMMSDIYAYHLGEKYAWEAVQQMKLFNSDQALDLGLVNESVEVEEVLPRAEVYMQQLLNIYGPVYSKTKQFLRKNLLQLVEVDIDAEARRTAEAVMDPKQLAIVRNFVSQLKK